MKTFILPGLTKEQLAKLRNGGIEFFGWKRGSILIETEDGLQKALGLLAAVATEAATGLDGLVELTLHYQSSDSAPAHDPERIRSRANYVKACSARFGNTLKTAQELVMNNRRVLPEREQSFVKLTRQSCFANKQSSDFREQFAQEMHALRDTAKVNRVRVLKNGEAILVFTDNLYAVAPDTNERHDLGKLLICIQVDGGRGGVRFYNATRRVSAARELMNAPYVYADGSLMANEINQTFLDLIARCEFAALADLAIQFIETVNDDYAGRLVSCWPRAPL